MKNTELINAYFDGELSEVEKESFIKRLDSETDLKKEFDLQSDIIGGIKEARKTELIAKLDAINIGSGSGSEIFSATKIAIIGGIAVLATVAYFGLKDTESEQKILSPRSISEPIENLLPEENTTDNESEEVLTDINKEKSELENSSANIKEKSSSSATVKKPEIHKPTLIEPLELTEEVEDDEINPTSGLEEKPSIATSSIDISIDDSKRRYDFHYQIKEGKLYLFGSFDKGLYEILEFNTRENKILYLYYKNKYYDLKTSSSEIQSLKEVTEPNLIQSLESIRK